MMPDAQIPRPVHIGVIDTRITSLVIRLPERRFSRTHRHRNPPSPSVFLLFFFLFSSLVFPLFVVPLPLPLLPILASHTGGRWLRVAQPLERQGRRERSDTGTYLSGFEQREGDDRRNTWHAPFVASASKIARRQRRDPFCLPAVWRYSVPAAFSVPAAGIPTASSAESVRHLRTPRPPRQQVRICDISH